MAWEAVDRNFEKAAMVVVLEWNSCYFFVGTQLSMV